MNLVWAKRSEGGSNSIYCLSLEPMKLEHQFDGNFFFLFFQFTDVFLDFFLKYGNHVYLRLALNCVFSLFKSIFSFWIVYLAFLSSFHLSSAANFCFIRDSLNFFRLIEFVDVMNELAKCLNFSLRKITEKYWGYTVPSVVTSVRKNKSPFMIFMELRWIKKKCPWFGLGKVIIYCLLVDFDYNSSWQKHDVVIGVRYAKTAHWPTQLQQ